MNIYELKNKLSKIYKKIETIRGLNYDTTFLKNEFDRINERLDNVFDTNANALTLSKKETTTLAAIDALINQLDEYTSRVYKKFAIYDDSDKVVQELNDDITQNKLDSIVSLILSDAMEYMDLYNSGYKNGRENELCNNLYKIIKCEFRIKGTSTLLSSLISMSVCTSEIKSLIDEDVKQNLDKKDIYKRYNEVLSLNNIDPKMVYLLALNENGMKDSILDKFYDAKNDLDKKEQNYNRQKMLKKDKLYDVGETFSHLRKSIFKALRVFIPNIVSVAILIGANGALNTGFKNEASYKTTGIVYDTVLGEEEDSIYTKLKDDEVLIRVYQGESDDKTREYIDYVIKNTGIPIEEYEDVELRKSNITATGSKYVSNLDYSSEDDEIKRIFIPTSFDYSDTDRSILLEILVHIALFFGWGLVDMLCAMLYETANQKTGNLAFTIAYKDKFLEALNEIMNEYKSFVEGLKSKENGHYDKSRYLKTKEEYEKAKNEYERLLKEFDKYDELLDYNGYTRKLK